MSIITPGQLWREYSEQRLLMEPDLVKLKETLASQVISPALRQGGVIHQPVIVTLPKSIPPQVIDVLRIELGVAGYYVVDLESTQDDIFWKVCCKL